MPLWSVQAIIAIFAIVAMASGVWLLLNLRALARIFRGTADLQPGPGPRGPSRKAVWTALVLFNLGWIASIAFWTWARDSDAAQAVEIDSVAQAPVAPVVPPD